MIFFDIDDTLVTHSQAQKQAADLFWEAFASRLSYSKIEFSAVWDTVMQKHFAAYTAGQISFREHRLHRMQEIFFASGKPLAEDEGDALFQVYLQHYEKSWALFADVLPCLKALSHCNLGIISNGNGEQQKRKLHRMGIEANFAVRDLNRSLIFYRNVLGLSLAAVWADGAYLRAGSAWIALNRDPNAPTAVSADYSHIAFSVAEEDFEALAERIRSCGAQIWQVNKSPGLSLYFTDPDNHKLEIHVSDLSDRLRNMMLEPPSGFSLMQTA